MSTDALVALTTQQASYLSASNVAALTTVQLLNVQNADLGAFSTLAIRGLTTLQLASLSTDQIAALSTAQTAAFTATQTAALTTTQIAAYSTPIVLDLNGDGVHTLGLAAGVQFDLLATGSAVQTGWVGSGDGLLALDRNHDGAINDGSELFGSSTVLASGERASDGYVALGELDSNHDGVVSGADAAFGDLRVWVDGNADGVSAAGELRTLGELGITELSLRTSAGQGSDNGNILGLNASYRTADGTEHAAADVWFQIQPGSAAGTASMGERVNTLAQAIGVFDMAADAAAAALPGALVPAGAGSAATGSASTAVAVGDMVDAMRRFAAAAPSALPADNAGTNKPAMPAMLASPAGSSDPNDALEQARRADIWTANLGAKPK